MLIRLGYDIQFQLLWPIPMVALLNVHPSREKDLLEPDELKIEPSVPQDVYFDSFGNRCVRFLAQPGPLRLFGATLIQDSGVLDEENPSAREVPVHELPTDVLRYLLASRYCEVDLLSGIAVDLFGNTKPGWERVQAICTWIHDKVRFGYAYARPTKTALDVFTERLGVCRDFQHLAITFCRALNIPARYATGYLGDIGVPPAATPMDFSAWFEVYLEDRWWTFDARHNERRIGRILMATGRDAADVAITTSFGSSTLTGFTVVTDEVVEERQAVAASSSTGVVAST
ncbi:MAG TPA: transglutaminase family protein [Bryobacteraceae bacterium]|jgi:transglutaminase-like putative cysteine protease|nr:transglutaminase family protein [Bryobacteraceae bacterium]